MSGRVFMFSSESVGEGHPDKVADAISDAVLDACLVQDCESRVACEVLVKSGQVVLAGEITSLARVDYEAVVRGAIGDIGYTDGGQAFSAGGVGVASYLTEQSPDIARGVDSAGNGEGVQQGAGDQGIMFGFACGETPEYLPAPITFAHRLTSALAQKRKAAVVDWLGPDCKAQVAVEYVGGRVARVVNVVLSTQHAEGVAHELVEDFCVEAVIRQQLPAAWLRDTQYYINPTGVFHRGGPHADAGLTGRKIVVDTYGGWSRHGGGAFSGKDPSKVDRSAAYMCRYVAKNIVAAGLAKCVELQVAYAIGKAQPTSIYVDTFGESRLSNEQLEAIVARHFDFRPAAIIEALDLKRPIYGQSTHYGHFGKDYLPWEALNEVETLKTYLPA